MVEERESLHSPVFEVATVWTLSLNSELLDHSLWTLSLGGSNTGWTWPRHGPGSLPLTQSHPPVIDSRCVRLVEEKGKPIEPVTCCVVTWTSVVALFFSGFLLESGVGRKWISELSRRALKTCSTRARTLGLSPDLMATASSYKLSH